jgi:hypothetical protein
MSIKLNLVAAAFALAAASLSGQGTALAGQACNGTWHQYLGGHYYYQCYYLPTVANGRVTGLAKYVNATVCRRIATSGPHHGSRVVCDKG